MSRCIPLARDLSDKSENKFSKIIPHLMPTILCTIATAYPQSKKHGILPCMVHACVT